MFGAYIIYIHSTAMHCFRMPVYAFSFDTADWLRIHGVRATAFIPCAILPPPFWRYTLSLQCNVVHVRTLASCFVWNYTPVEIFDKRGISERNNIVRFLHFNSLWSSPQTWRHGFMLSSLTSLHLVYKRYSRLHCPEMSLTCFPWHMMNLIWSSSGSTKYMEYRKKQH